MPAPLLLECEAAVGLKGKLHNCHIRQSNQKNVVSYT